MNSKAQQLFQPNILLFLLILVNIMVGSLIVSDYGGGWDDVVEFERGEQSYAFYYDETADESIFDPHEVKFYGPVYNMVMFRAVETIQEDHPEWHPYVLNHLINFLTYQVGILGFYFLASRLLGKWVGLLSTALYSYQPLLFGHAFNNPKDIPFLAFFVAAVAIGVIMADRFAGREPEAESATTTSFREKWEAAEPKKKRVFIALLIVWLILLFVFVVFKWFIDIFLASWMEAIYYAPPATLMGKLFSVISEQAANAPLVNYQTRIVSLFTTASWLSLVIFPLLMGAVVVRAIAPGTRPFSQEFGRLYRGYLLAARDILTETLFNRFFLLALAGIVLGLSMSIRVLGPAAGGIVGLYFLLKHGKKAVLPLVLYTVTSALVMYGTWPYLWLDPLPNFLSSLRAMSSFLFVRPVLFDGVVLSSRAIPSSYVPTLLALKFTEPFVILCLVGLVAALLMFVRREKFSEQTLFILTLLWFFFPFTYFVVARPGMYDNIRQILFITPPLGILAGFGFKWVLGKVKGTPFRVLLVGLVLLPNLYYLVSLHPYEYIYFNAFTGGVQGAYRQYELDYWGTSYKEAVEYLNQVAEKDALVAVFGPLLVARQYKREDLQFERGSRLSSLEEAGVDYVIMTTRENMDLEYALDGTVIYIVTRDGAVLAIVYKIE